MHWDVIRSKKWAERLHTHRHLNEDHVLLSLIHFEIDPMWSVHPLQCLCLLSLLHCNCTAIHFLLKLRIWIVHYAWYECILPKWWWPITAVTIWDYYLCITLGTVLSLILLKSYAVYKILTSCSCQSDGTWVVFGWIGLDKAERAARWTNSSEGAGGLNQ